MGMWAPAARLARRWQLRAGQRALRGCGLTVDLLSLLRGQDHGGARVAALSLLRELRRAAPWLRQRALVSSPLAGEVADLPADEVDVVPEAGPGRERLLGEARRAGLVLSPLGGPSLGPCVAPVVALVTRLGHLRHPEQVMAFERERRAEELRGWLSGCALALCARPDDARLLAQASPGLEVRSVPLAPETRWPADAAPDEGQLARLGLRPGFLFYPANYWPHKNHELLLAAYSVGARTGALPPLACAGGAEEPRRELQARVRQMGLEGRVALLPALSEAGLAHLYQGCRAVVLPWLRGGLAWPVREAARFGRPVFCSRFTRLPAGFPARLFDPRPLPELADVLARAAAEEPWPARRPEASDAAGAAAVAALARAWRRAPRRAAA